MGNVSGVNGGESFCASELNCKVNRYVRIRPPMPSNFIFKIFPKVYHTFGHTFLPPTQNEEDQENRKEFLNKRDGSDFIQEIVKSDSASQNEEIHYVPQLDMATAYAISNSDGVGVKSRILKLIESTTYDPIFDL